MTQKKILTSEEVEIAQKLLAGIIDNVEIALIGKRPVVELVVLSLVCGGHVLIEDVPGVGKTSLVSALAKTVSCRFKRIQFTPDVMPSDISGFSVYNQKSGEFEFRPGAIMSNIVLADEINRASAKTQASLLEAMEEKQVTVDSNTYLLQEPFMVLATQNPLDSFGTYPLPEAQIDRFLIKIAIGYPTPEQEIEVAYNVREAKKELRSVVSGATILQLRQMAQRVHIARPAAQYIVSLVTATRSHAELDLGSSPRGTLALFDLARAYALMSGRNYVTADDIKYLAPHVLSHRVTLNHDAKVSGRTGKDVIASILNSVAVPKGEVQ